VEYLISDLFEGVGSEKWAAQIFRRAWYDHDGPMSKVIQRLESGFSVLVYLPGSLMNAAAKFVQDSVGNPNDWNVLGNHPGKGGTLERLWQAPGDLVDVIQKWLKSPRTKQPDAIVMNMDRMFFDNNHGVINSSGAQMALFSLLESIRHARTVGLADSTFGNLPASVETAFSEHRVLEGVDFAAFPSLIPWELAEALGAREERPLPDDVHRQLWSRLRWVEPVRAVRLMLDAATYLGVEERRARLSRAIELLTGWTRPMSFKDPRSEFVRDGSSKEEQEQQIAQVEQGFPEAALALLKDCIVDQYRAGFDALSGRAPRELTELLPGAILFGPPGTGKTWLAQWMAVKIGIPVRVVSGADLRVRDFGGTERKIVELFREARRAAPCMLILDDADDLLKERRLAQGAVAGAEVATVNTFLQQLAGFDGKPTGVLVVVTSNQFDRLDAAVRDRLKLHIPVSYAANAEQVEKLVRVLADELRLDLKEDILEKLVQRFLKPPYLDRNASQGVTPGQPGLQTAAQRRRMRGNLFSPREMRFAMLLLKARAGSSRHAPTDEDLSRLDGYYKALSDCREVQDLIKDGNL
jgi:hypothetical protein